jgi:DNA-directed RNA polymerase specialized sigma24 family protein
MRGKHGTWHSADGTIRSMPTNHSSSITPRQPEAKFHSTHWSLVLAAAETGDAGGNAALAELCQRYWYPLYVYVRRQWADTHTAQDLVQGFFLHLLERGSLEKANRERGRFRSFLLTAFNNYRKNQWKRDQALRRGGGVRPLPLDFQAGESWLRLEPCDHLTPERQYQRQWTLTLLESVMNTLAAEMNAAGKGALFQQLKPTLQGAAERGFYEAAAEELDMSPAAAKQAAHRLKGRYRELLRAEVAQTVADPSEIDDELRSLLAALG